MNAQPGVSLTVTTGENRIMAKKSKDDTLLAHLAWMLSSRHEDVAVEALGYILKSASARRVLEDLMKVGGADSGEIVSVQTQVGGEEGTRPDLVGFDRNSVECLIIEAKFWAGLTANQPNAYLKRLLSDKALLFVAPVSRIETLWAELRRRAGEYGSIGNFTHTTEFKSASVDREECGRKHLMLISWQDLLDQLQNDRDCDMNDEIMQLKGFINRTDESGFPPLGPEELALDIPRRLNGLRKLVDDATVRAVEHGDRTRITARNVGYGRYLRIAGTGTWFGIDTDRWARGSYPDTPLWLIFEQWTEDNSVPLSRTREALRSLMHKDPGECIDEDSAVLVPIPLPTEVEYDMVLEAVVERIRTVAELILNNASGEISR